MALPIRGQTGFRSVRVLMNGLSPIRPVSVIKGIMFGIGLPHEFSVQPVDCGSLVR
jgi:hypothetical protein